LTHYKILLTYLLVMSTSHTAMALSVLVAHVKIQFRNKWQIN